MRVLRLLFTTGAFMGVVGATHLRGLQETNDGVAATPPDEGDLEPPDGLVPDGPILPDLDDGFDPSLVDGPDGPDPVDDAPVIPDGPAEDEGEGDADPAGFDDGEGDGDADFGTDTGDEHTADTPDPDGDDEDANGGEAAPSEETDGAGPGPDAGDDGRPDDVPPPDIEGPVGGEPNTDIGDGPGDVDDDDTPFVAPSHGGGADDMDFPEPGADVDEEAPPEIDDLSGIDFDNLPGNSAEPPSRLDELNEGD